jgi:hypothetical protein
MVAIVALAFAAITAPAHTDEDSCGRAWLGSIGRRLRLTARRRAGYHERLRDNQRATALYLGTTPQSSERSLYEMSDYENYVAGRAWAHVAGAYARLKRQSLEATAIKASPRDLALIGFVPSLHQKAIALSEFASNSMFAIDAPTSDLLADGF